MKKDQEPAANAENQAQQPAFNRGGVNVAQTSELAPIAVSPENRHPEVYLFNVSSDTINDDEKGELHSLTFELRTPDNIQGTKLKLFPVTNDVNYRTKDGEAVFTVAQQIERQDFVIGHWYDSFKGMGSAVKDGLGANATGWHDFFNKIADAFNAGNNGKPVYKDNSGKYILCRVRLVFDKSNYLSIPKNGNFFEVVREGITSKLPNYAGDKVTPVAKASKDDVKSRVLGSAASNPQAAEGGDLPPGFM